MSLIQTIATFKTGPITQGADGTFDLLTFNIDGASPGIGPLVGPTVVMAKWNVLVLKDGGDHSSIVQSGEATWKVETDLTVTNEDCETIYDYNGPTFLVISVSSSTPNTLLIQATQSSSSEDWIYYCVADFYIYQMKE